jgi:hypothetical protein
MGPSSWKGRVPNVFELPNGRQVEGHDLQQHHEWPWRHSEQVPKVRYARLRAISPTYGAVTLIVIEEPREQQFYLMCLATAISGPRLRVICKGRLTMEEIIFNLKHYLRFVDSEPLELKALSQGVDEKTA